LKTLFCLLFISAQLFAFGQNDDLYEGEVLPFASVDIPPVTTFCQEELGDFKQCFNNSMLHHVEENFEFPAIAEEVGFNATVYISFIVEKDATVSHIKIERGATYKADKENSEEIAAAMCIDKEALRIVQELKFIAPATVNHQPVRMSYIIPIKAVPKTTKN
tara:strand:+ start:102 stop:587 length:486 start_codon:yes stop_codon:yes gene_type:complete